MNPTIVVAMISTAAALLSVAATYIFGKKKDREADWRKVRLEHYREFVEALSGITGRRNSAENQIRYSNAVNSLTLVAPPSVLQALYVFQEEIGPRNLNKSASGHDAALGVLLREIRADIHPTIPDDRSLQFRLFDALPLPSDIPQIHDGT